MMFAVKPSAFGQIITDLRVNDEPDTSAFIALNPSLHVFSPERFLVVWSDDRQGEFTAWGNFFDGDARPVTDDFSILGDEVVLPELGEDFTVIAHRSEFSGVSIEDYWVGYRQRYRGIRPLAEPVEIDRFQLPIDYFGDLGTRSDLVRTRWGFAYVSNFIGTLFLRRFDRQFQELGQPRQHFYETVKDFTLSLSPDSARAWVVFRITIPGGSSQPAGLYLATIDSLASDIGFRTVMLDSSLRNDQLSPMHTHIRNDSTLATIFAKGDSLLEIRFLTDSTLQQRRAHLIPLPEWPGAMSGVFSPLSLLVTNAQQNVRKLMVSGIQEGYEGQERTWRSLSLVYDLFDDSLSMEPSQAFILDQKASVARHGQAFLTEAEGIKVPVSIYPRNYVLQARKDGSTSLTPLGNLPNGANQTWPVILPEDDQNFWVSWYAGNAGPAQYRARRIDANGQLASQAQLLPTREGIFLQNGRLFVIKASIAPDSTKIQMWEVANNLLERELALKRRTNWRSLHKLAEDRFFLFGRREGSAIVEVYNVAGLQLDSLTVPASQSPYETSQVYPLSDGRYWLRTNAFYLWNPETRQLSAPAAIPQESNVWPVSADRILSVKLTYPTLTTTIARFTLRDTSGQILIADRMLTNDGNTFPIAVKPLPQGHFLILYRQGSSYMAQVFKPDFTPVQNAFAPFPQATPKVVLPLVETLKERVVFATSDVREGGTGRDVYASVYEVQRLLTSVAEVNSSSKSPNEFVLHRLSPNPMRVGQALQVSFSLSKRAAVEFRVYNVLGQIIQHFPAQRFEQGLHKINLTMIDMPAGIYFLQARNAANSVVSKFAVLR